MNLGTFPLSMIVMGVLAHSGATFAGGLAQSGHAIQEGRLASGLASGSAAHAISASGQVSSAVSAVPLASAGEVFAATGAGSTAAAQESARASNQALEITDETITAMPPPNEVLKTGKARNAQ